MFDFPGTATPSLIYPEIACYALPERTVVVPEDWAKRWRAARRDDIRNGKFFLGVFSPSWDARHAVEEAFEAAVADGLEVADF